MIRFLQLLILFFFLFSSTLFGQNHLSDEAEVSIYTCGPGEELYSLFGHNAIRVYDPVSRIDAVYNYGTFDFNAPGFGLKFLRGKLPYQLSKSSVQNFLNEYYYYQRSVDEQFLNLTSDQKNNIYNFLENNIKPENREYAYDFYFDNCTTRIRDILTNETECIYPSLIQNEKTFRDLLHEYNDVHPWTQFGMDIILGTLSDRVTTDKDRMFLPEYFFQYVAKTSTSGSPIVTRSDQVLRFPSVSKKQLLLSPKMAFGVILLVEILLSLLLLKKGNERFAKWWDGIWFGALFLSFLVFLFMWFGTDHKVCNNNWNLLWTTPWMIFALYADKKMEVALYTLMFSLLVLLCWSLIPQFIPFTCVLIIFITMIKSFRISWPMVTTMFNPKSAAAIIVFLSIVSFSQAQEKIAGITLVAPPREYDQDPMMELKQVNANWVALVPYGFTPQGSAEVKFGSDKQWWGERIEGIEKSIDLARKNGLKVMLKPQVWIRGGWVGDMDFDNEADWKVWEDSYRAYILSLVNISEKHKIDLFCIGTEYRISAVKREAFWRGLIKEIRQTYKGKLTYSANWDAYEKIPFWDALDYVGISAYFPLTDMDTPPALYLSYKWRKVKKSLRKFYEKNNRQILFTEYGYLAVDGAAGKTWELEKEMHTLPVNEQAQANGYEALIGAFGEEDFWAGGFLWKWFPKGYHRQERAMMDYTPQGKKAQQILAKEYAKLSAQ